MLRACWEEKSIYSFWRNKENWVRVLRKTSCSRRYILSHVLKFRIKTYQLHQMSFEFSNIVSFCFAIWKITNAEFESTFMTCGQVDFNVNNLSLFVISNDDIIGITSTVPKYLLLILFLLLSRSQFPLQKKIIFSGRNKLNLF